SQLKAFWNVASDRCQEKKKVDIPLSQFDIVHNRDQKFFGEKIVLFYETQFGLFPYYNNSDPNQPVNGGLPQNASLPRHLHEVIKQILIKIPDPWFPGLAVIDFEAWRPLYEMNWGKKKVSLRLPFFTPFLSAITELQSHFAALKKRYGNSQTHF
ncbi:hyaluronoglucosaminidase, partial [Ostertagia ostertagi]